MFGLCAVGRERIPAQLSENVRPSGHRDKLSCVSDARVLTECARASVFQEGHVGTISESRGSRSAGAEGAGDRRPWAGRLPAAGSLSADDVCSLFGAVRPWSGSLTVLMGV